MNDINRTDEQRRERNKKSETRSRGTKGPPSDACINVYLKDVGPPPNRVPYFDIVTDLPKSGSGHNPPIEFKNGKGHCGFNITFVLFDETNNGAGSGYQFATDELDAVWSQFGTTCPRSRVSQVFSNVAVLDETHLRVVNENPDVGGGNGQGYFQYTLNVSTDGLPDYVSLDPGGINQNGGTQRY